MFRVPFSSFLKIITMGTRFIFKNIFSSTLCFTLFLCYGLWSLSIFFGTIRVSERKLRRSSDRPDLTFLLSSFFFLLLRRWRGDKQYTILFDSHLITDTNRKMFTLNRTSDLPFPNDDGNSSFFFAFLFFSFAEGFGPRSDSNVSLFYFKFFVG